MLTSVIGLLLWIMFIVGAMLLFRGLRGAPEFSAPMCRKCRYDLRAHILKTVLDDMPKACPECGSDLSGPKAVRFGEYKRRPVMIRWGAGLAGIPLLLVVITIVQAVMGIQWSDYEPTQRIIDRLATTADQPWDWNRLVARYNKGRLSSAEIEAAIDQLIVHINSRKNKNAPLHWVDDFLESIHGDGQISDEQFGRLCEAFYDLRPTVRTPARAPQGKPIQFDVHGVNHWNLLDMQQAMALREVRTRNGDKLVARSNQESNPSVPQNMDLLSTSRRNAISGSLTGDLKPGAHELIYVFDIGIFDKGVLFRAEDGLPGQTTKWPKHRHQWSCEVKSPLQVVGAREATIELVRDPQLDPAKTGLPKVKRLYAVPYRGRSKVTLELLHGGGLSGTVAWSFDVFLRFGQREHRIGALVRHPENPLHGGIRPSSTRHPGMF